MLMPNSNRATLVILVRIPGRWVQFANKHSRNHGELTDAFDPNLLREFYISCPSSVIHLASPFLQAAMAA
jgi:hypothetical protein